MAKCEPEYLECCICCRFYMTSSGQLWFVNRTKRKRGKAKLDGTPCLQGNCDGQNNISFQRICSDKACTLQRSVSTIQSGNENRAQWLRKWDLNETSWVQDQTQTLTHDGALSQVSTRPSLGTLSLKWVEKQYRLLDIITRVRWLHIVRTAALSKHAVCMWQMPQPLGL